MPCARCGAESHLEYAPDGQSYCSACLFYGLNKPCWKCRMYLPSTELQQYRGQWTCQYCMMDLKDAERKAEEAHHPVGEAKAEPGHEKEMLTGVPEDEFCDRCKRKMAIVYIFNNRKLCEVCIEREKKEFEESGGGAMPMILKFRVKGNEGILARLSRKLELAISWLFERKGKKKAEAAKKPEMKDSEKKGKGSEDEQDDFSKHFKD